MHSHHQHGHNHRPEARTSLLIALAMTGLFAVVEAVGGWVAGSLALIGDAGHMVSDSMALGVAAVGAWMARKPATARHSFGLGRAEVVAALFNALLMLGVVGGIVVSAVHRLRTPAPVDAATVILIGIIGLLVNIAVGAVLLRGEKNLNIRGALIHVIGDLLGSVAALTAGVVILYTGWTTIDPLLSLLICLLITLSAIRLLRDVLHVMLEGVPPGINLPEIGRNMARQPGVNSVHDLHIWTVSSRTTALSAHVVVEDMAEWERILAELRDYLNREYAINHVTLQPEAAVLAAVPVEEIRPER